MLVGRLGQSPGDAPAPPDLRNPDGLPLNLQNPHSGLSAEVHVSLQSFGCVSADIAYDAEPPQLAAALRGPNSLSPSVLTLTCLDPWRQCQVLANNLTPAGFLNATADNPGHCQFHSTHQLSVLHQAD